MLIIKFIGVLIFMGLCIGLIKLYGAPFTFEEVALMVRQEDEWFKQYAQIFEVVIIKK